jgi:type II secretory pathway component PulM
MSARDKKLLTIFVPLAIFAMYWLLLLNPALNKREDLQKPIDAAQVERDEAVALAHEMTEAKVNYKKDYAELVTLSKAIPQSVAVSDLMRELNEAAEGMGIEFTDITMAAADAPTETEPGAVSPDTQILDEIPVELTFDGRFFALSDLFRSIQRFVQVADGELEVHGRLIRIEKFSFDSSSFPNITAQISATIYAAPANEGPTGGATPVGPPGAERGDGGLEPVQNFSPAATVTP